MVLSAVSKHRIRCDFGDTTARRKVHPGREGLSRQRPEPASRELEGRLLATSIPPMPDSVGLFKSI